MKTSRRVALHLCFASLAVGIVVAADDPQATPSAEVHGIVIEDPTVTGRSQYPVGRVDAVSLDTGKSRGVTSSAQGS